MNALFLPVGRFRSLHSGLFAVLLVMACMFGAATSARAEDMVTVRVVPEKSVVRPGDQIAVAVVIEHTNGFHTWPEASVSLPADVEESAGQNRTKLSVPNVPAWVQRIDGIQWPKAHLGKVNNPSTGVGTIEVPLYSDQAVAFLRVVVSPDAQPGEQKLPISMFYQACDDKVCLMPTDLELVATVRVAPKGSLETGVANEPGLFSTFDVSSWGQTAAPAAATRKPVKFDFFGLSFTLGTDGAGFVLLLLVAALGGLLLNFTPCVLPVIPIKIIGLSNAAGNPARCFFLGLVMSLGVVAFWVAIGGAMAFISGFKTISTLFQIPWFGLGVGVFMLVMSIGMFGAFVVSLPQWVYLVNPKHETAPGSFVFGILTAVLSTPCTAPFMGAAAAWAALQSPHITISTFAAIGVGMALPYLILSANTKLVSRMPRTGPASELIKQVMGLLMLGVAVFFVGPPIAGWLNTPPDPVSRAYWWAVGAFGAAAGVWLLWRTVRITKKPGRRVFFGGVGAAIVAASLAVAVTLSSHGPIKWVYYTPERFAQAIAEGNVVVLDFTAEWCLNCKALESGVLHQSEIVSLLNSGQKVVPMKVDITKDNPAGKAKLAELNWVGIPLLAVFGPGLPEPLKFDTYTPDVVLNAVKQARGAKSASAK